MFECKLCSLVVNSQDQLTQHLSGKSHRKRMKAAGYMETGLDSTIEPPPVLQTDPLNLQQSAPQPVDSAPRKRKLSGDPDPDMCPLCNVVFNSTQQAEQHYTGSKHLKKKKLITGETTTESNSHSQSGALYCGFCKIEVNSPEIMEVHKQGKKHRKNYEKMQTYPVAYCHPSEKNDGYDFPGSWKNKYQQVAKKSTEANNLFSESGMLYCGFCSIHVNSMEQLELHRQGTKHKKIFEKVKSTPVSYPSFTKRIIPKPPEAPKELPPFESYLTTFVKSNTTDTTVQSHLKG